MDYLSIDTEGSESTILQSLDFKERKFRIITVEHNYVRPERDDIFSLLSSHGYEKPAKLERSRQPFSPEPPRVRGLVARVTVWKSGVHRRLTASTYR